MITTYIWVCLFVFLLLGIIWKHSNALNLVIKLALLGLVAWSGYLLVKITAHDITVNEGDQSSMVTKK